MRSTGAMVRSWQSLLWAEGLGPSWSDVDGVSIYPIDEGTNTADRQTTVGWCPTTSA